MEFELGETNLPAVEPEQGFAKETVILLHGLGRGIGVMAKLRDYLELHSFDPHNIGYPSTKYPIEQLSKLVREKIAPILCKTQTKIHFVGHSLGSLIIRYLLQHHPLKNMGRVVMLAPPNNGTRLVDVMKRFGFYRKLYGPAGCQLGEKDNKFLDELELPDYEYGVIAGDKSVDLLFSWLILKGPDDGKVTVENTMLENMTDHLVVHASHPFLPSDKVVMQQTAYFLAHGYFQKFD